MTSGLAGHRRTVHPALAEFKKYVKYWDLCLMLAPVIAYFIIFKYIPMGGIVIAFKDYKLGLGISGSMWVGFENFIQGVYVMLSFLEMNGIRIRCTDEELVHVGLSVASGSMGYEELLEWVIDHKE